MRPHLECCILSYNTSIQCFYWFIGLYMGGLITLCIEVRENGFAETHKQASKTSRYSPLLPPNRWEISGMKEHFLIVMQNSIFSMCVLAISFSWNKRMNKTDEHALQCTNMLSIKHQLHSSNISGGCYVGRRLLDRHTDHEVLVVVKAI